jgi:hypothetical protein
MRGREATPRREDYRGVIDFLCGDSNLEKEYMDDYLDLLREQRYWRFPLGYKYGTGYRSCPNWKNGHGRSSCLPLSVCLE